jgi:hypothetical protein
MLLGFEVGEIVPRDAAFLSSTGVVGGLLLDMFSSPFPNLPAPARRMVPLLSVFGGPVRTVSGMDLVTLFLGRREGRLRKSAGRSMGEDRSDESGSEGGRFWGVLISLSGTAVVDLVVRKVWSSLFLGFAGSFLA